MPYGGKKYCHKSVFVNLHSHFTKHFSVQEISCYSYRYKLNPSPSKKIFIRVYFISLLKHSMILCIHIFLLVNGYFIRISVENKGQCIDYAFQIQILNFYCCLDCPHPFLKQLKWNVQREKIQFPLQPKNACARSRNSDYPAFYICSDHFG